MTEYLYDLGTEKEFLNYTEKSIQKIKKIYKGLQN